MNAILEALRGTRETVRYIGQDMSREKREAAESKLMAAQMDYKKAAMESEMEFKKKEHAMRVAQFKFDHAGE